MSFFKNMEQPETNDISKLPAYAELPEEAQREVNIRYQDVYLASQRMGIRIAQGMAYTAAKQMCESHVMESASDISSHLLKALKPEQECLH